MVLRVGSFGLASVGMRVEGILWSGAAEAAAIGGCATAGESSNKGMPHTCTELPYI